MRRIILVLATVAVGLIVGAIGVGGSSTMAAAASCDQVPTGVATEDYWIKFKEPHGLMPDDQFAELPAQLQVHRVKPVYANGKCSGVATQAAVLIHGRVTTGPVAFDLQGTDSGGHDLSVQKGLAQAGIDTFAPSLLGYGKSTRFSLDDPGNASLRGYSQTPDGLPYCPYPEGCDRTLVAGINPLDQQGRTLSPPGLFVNPLAGERRAHSSKFRFAGTDVWVRDIDQVINDALVRAKPSDGKVALVGYSFGGERVGRMLYAGNPLGGKLLETRSKMIGRVSRVVFLNSLFGVPGGPGGSTEEPPGTDRPTFPLTLNDRAGSDAGWRMPTQDRETACAGHVIPGTQGQLWTQTMEQDTVGREWGGDDPTHPTGLNRAPTFSRYGWNPEVAGQMSTPTLVIQGLEDTVVPTGPGTGQVIYDALPTSMTNKVLVEEKCASHALPWEGADSWAGPHDMLKNALIEWIKSGTFNGAPNGKFTVDESGVASATPGA